MAAYVHAALMAEYAKDALETDKPWEQWEIFSDTDEKWVSLSTHPGWMSQRQYRRKPVKIYLYGNFKLSGYVGCPDAVASTRYSDQREVDSNIEYEFIDNKLVNVRLLT